MAVRYIHLRSGQKPPAIDRLAPYRAIIIAEEDHTADWRNEISRWLVDTGCLYMMAWGIEATKWDDSVDETNLVDFNFGDIPKDRFVYTTWHDDDTLEDVFWKSHFCANHDCIDLQNTMLVHISETADEMGLLAKHTAAQQDV